VNRKNLTVEALQPKDLSGVERLYHDWNCGCTLCEKENDMEMKRSDVLVDKSSGFTMFFSGEDFDRKAADDLLMKNAKHYHEHWPDKYPTLADAVRVILQRHPKLAARYFGRPVLMEGGNK